VRNWEIAPSATTRGRGGRTARPRLRAQGTEGSRGSPFGGGQRTQDFFAKAVERVVGRCQMADAETRLDRYERESHARGP
jgi:hypothetical protein